SAIACSSDQEASTSESVQALLGLDASASASGTSLVGATPVATSSSAQSRVESLLARCGTNTVIPTTNLADAGPLSVDPRLLPPSIRGGATGSDAGLASASISAPDGGDSGTSGTSTGLVAGTVVDGGVQAGPTSPVTLALARLRATGLPVSLPVDGG